MRRFIVSSALIGGVYSNLLDDISSNLLDDFKQGLRKELQGDIFKHYQATKSGVPSTAEISKFVKKYIEENDINTHDDTHLPIDLHTATRSVITEKLKKLLPTDFGEKLRKLNSQLQQYEEGVPGDSNNSVGSTNSLSSVWPVIPDSKRNASELITSKGYPLEVHEVKTKDGWILGMFRIPHGVKNYNPKAKRPPIVMQHGLLDSCATWIVNEAWQSLGFIMADAGFDVWLPNVRGNSYSLKHTNYTRDAREFWDFSFDEMAYNDVPSVVDHVLENSDPIFTQIGWIGHSQGTLIMNLALSIHGETFQKKIKHFSALAPVGNTYNVDSTLIRALIELRVDEMFQMFGLKEFMVSPAVIKLIAGPLCDIAKLGEEVCENILFLIVGTNDEPLHNMNATRISVYLYNTPAGTSVRNMVHWAQTVKNGGLNMYDYGHVGNLIHYSAWYPPAYDLKKIANTKISIYSGGNDVLADPKDILILLNLLGGDVVTNTNYQSHYQHLDFTWGIDCHETIYPLVRGEMEAAFDMNKPEQPDSSQTPLYV